MKRFLGIVKYFVKTYPLSLIVVALVVYASLLRIPQDAVPKVPDLDKVVHVGMYLVLSGMLWAEFLRVFYKKKTPLWHAWVGACLCPVLFGGFMELMQGWCTELRNASWLDFAANVLGVVLASLAGFGAYRYLSRKKRNS